MDVIGTMEVIGEVVICDVGGVNRGGGGDVLRFRNGLCIILPKISRSGMEDIG